MSSRSMHLVKHAKIKSPACTCWLLAQEHADMINRLHIELLGCLV